MGGPGVLCCVPVHTQAAGSASLTAGPCGQWGPALRLSFGVTCGDLVAVAVPPGPPGRVLRTPSPGFAGEGAVGVLCLGPQAPGSSQTEQSRVSQPRGHGDHPARRLSKLPLPVGVLWVGARPGPSGGSRLALLAEGLYTEAWSPVECGPFTVPPAGGQGSPSQVPTGSGTGRAMPPRCSRGGNPAPGLSSPLSPVCPAQPGKGTLSQQGPQ